MNWLIWFAASFEEHFNCVWFSILNLPHCVLVYLSKPWARQPHWQCRSGRKSSLLWSLGARYAFPFIFPKLNFLAGWGLCVFPNIFLNENIDSILTPEYIEYVGSKQIHMYIFEYNWRVEAVGMLSRNKRICSVLHTSTLEGNYIWPSWKMKMVYKRNVLIYSEFGLAI